MKKKIERAFVCNALFNELFYIMIKFYYKSREDGYTLREIFEFHLAIRVVWDETGVKARLEDNIVRSADIRCSFTTAITRFYLSNKQICMSAVSL